MEPIKLTIGELDQLRIIMKKGAIWDGDLNSKNDRTGLANASLVLQDNGWNFPNWDLIIAIHQSLKIGELLTIHLRSFQQKDLNDISDLMQGMTDRSPADGSWAH